MLPLAVTLGEVAEVTDVLPGLELGELTGELEEEPDADELESTELEELHTDGEVAKVDGVAVLVGETVSTEETMPLDPEVKETEEEEDTVTETDKDEVVNDGIDVVTPGAVVVVEPPTMLVVVVWAVVE